MKLTIHRLFGLVAFFSICVTSSAQTTYYYVGGDGGSTELTTGANWSTSLGGAAVGGTISPSATTNYVVDGADVSSTSGAQAGASMTIAITASRTIGTFTVLNNNISVSLTGLNYTLTCGDFTVNSGTTFTNQTVVSTSGNLVNNGTLSYGNSSGEFTFTGTAKTISGNNTTQFRKFTIAAGATISLQRNIEITGNLVSFINGTLDAQTYTISEGGTATTASVSLAGTGILRTANLLGVRGQAGATINPNLTLTMNTGNTIDFNAPSGTQDIWCGNSVTYYHNIVISGGGTKRLVNGSATWIDIRGSLTIGSGNTLDASATGDATNIKNIEFTVNFTNNGTFIARTGTVVIAGSGGTQVVTMNGSSIWDLELANPTSNAASLGSDATVDHNIIFTNGRLLLGNYNLTMGPTAGYSGTPSNLKMLVTNGNGELKKVIPAGGQQFTYAVGDIISTAEYSPVTLNLTTNTAQRTIGCRVVDMQHPNDGTSTSYISRYWHFSESPTGGSYTYNAVFTFLAADLVGSFSPMLASYIYLPNTTWTGITSTPAATSITVTGTNQSLNGSEVTGRVTAGCTPPAQPQDFTTSSASVCAGQTGVTYTVPNDPTVAYTWSYSGTGATINGSGNSITVDFANNATGGTLSVTAVNGCSSTPRTITITINPNVGTPSFTAGATSLCAGATSTYTATASNSTGISYSIVGNTGASINANTGVVSNITGNFTVRATATGACGNPTTADRAVTVTPNVGTPSFTSGATSLCAGATSTYAATALNSTGITYSIVGNTGASINPNTGVVSNVTGNFTVRATATGACGNPTTADIAVTVTSSLTISQQPVSQDVCLGEPVTFSVIAGGSNMQYQWYLGGNIIPNATAASYIINSTNQASAGNYTVAITSSCGNATSNVAVLNVLPTISNTLTEVICNGSSYNFNGTELTVAGSYYDTLQSVQTGCDSIITLVLNVNNPVALLTITNGINLSVGTGYSNYEWYLNGNLIEGANGSTYTATENGSYTVTVTDSIGCSRMSNQVNVTTLSIAEDLAKLSIYPNPVSQSVFLKGYLPAGKWTMNLSDVTGRMVLSEVLVTTSGELNKQVDMAQLKTGIYLLTLYNADGQGQTYKLIKSE